MEKVSIERSIWIAATRERVWQAITDPRQIEQWFSPGVSWQSTGFEVGAKIYVVDSQTGAEMYTQVIELIDPPHKLVTRSQPEAPAKPETTSYILNEENGGTRLTLLYTGYEGLSDDDRRKRMEQDSMGFGMVLENIKAQAEGRDLPNPQGF
jgi:uncharacterized protein YndB with AHSA1/START domain